MSITVNLSISFFFFFPGNIAKTLLQTTCFLCSIHSMKYYFLNSDSLVFRIACTYHTSFSRSVLLWPLSSQETLIALCPPGLNLSTSIQNNLYLQLVLRSVLHQSHDLTPIRTFATSGAWNTRADQHFVCLAQLTKHYWEHNSQHTARLSSQPM